MSEPRRAKVFWSGRSQAVRLPKDFRFDGEEVMIRREGNSVILEPIEKPTWPPGFWEAMHALPPFPDDFALPGRPGPSAEPSYREDVIEGWVEGSEER